MSQPLDNRADAPAASFLVRALGPNLAMFVLGLAFCTLWSSAFVAAKFGLTVAPPLTQLTIRFLFAGAVLFVLMAALNKSWPTNRRDIVTGILLGLLNNAAYLGLFFMAMQTITAGLAALIAAMTPLVTVFAAAPILGEKITRRRLLGVLVGFSGAAIVLQGRLDGGFDAPIGIILGLVGMCCLTAGTILYRKRGASADPFVMNSIQTIASGVILLPVSLLFEDWGDVVLNHVFFLSVGYLAFMVSIVALLLWFALIRMAGAGRASAFHFLNPGLGMLFGWAILSEPVSAIDLLGLVPIVIGIVLVTWTPAARTPKAV